MLGRRKFLQALGAAPVAAPLALKKAAEDTVAKLSHVGMMGGVNDNAPCNTSDGNSTTKMFRQALHLGFKKELQAAIYEEEKYVGYIDADIAIMRSLSLSAKIAYQRQRNVKRRMDDMTNAISRWGRLDTLLKKLLNLSF